MRPTHAAVGTPHVPHTQRQWQANPLRPRLPHRHIFGWGSPHIHSTTTSTSTRTTTCEAWSWTLLEFPGSGVAQYTIPCHTRAHTCTQAHTRVRIGVRVGVPLGNAACARLHAAFYHCVKTLGFAWLQTYLFVHGMR